MNTVMFDLQTAVMAASASMGGGIPDLKAGDAGEGLSFSDVLAAQAGGNAVTDVQAENTVPEDGYIVPEEFQKTGFEEIAAQLAKADNGMLKGLKMLLETVIKALRGPDDGQARKTDLFSMFYDGSASLTGDDEDMFLLCGEFMNRMGEAIVPELEEASEDDGIIEALKKMLERMYGTKGKDKDEDDDEDEIAADILAALLGSPETEEELEEYVLENKTEVIESVKEVFSYPKQVITEADPEKAEKMEALYADFKAYVNADDADKGHAEINFSGIRINNAAEQVRAISGDAEEENAAAEIAGLNAEPQIIWTGTEIPEEEFDAGMSESVEDQITETITERLFDMADRDGTEELVMVLKPENLGQVAIKLVKENGTVSVMLSAQHAEVGRMMAERAAALSSGLESRNIEVKNVEVVNPSNAAAQMGLDFTNQGFSRRQEYSSESNRGSYRGIQSVSEIDEIEETEDINIREAKLWTTA